MARNPCAAWTDGVQDTMSLLANDLDAANAEQLHLLATCDLLSQCFEVAFNGFADEFLGECAFLAVQQTGQLH